MKIIEKARGTQIPLHAQRVFFCYNKKEKTKQRGEIISDLLSIDAGMDCVVTYVVNPEESADTTKLQSILYETQLLVIWVTVTMLQSIGREKSLT